MGKTMAIIGECLRHGRSVSTDTSHPHQLVSDPPTLKLRRTQSIFAEATADTVHLR